MTVRGLSQIIFPTVSVTMTLRGGGGGGGGGWESEGVTLTNQAFFFHKKWAGHCQRKRWKKTTGAAKKPCTQSIMQKYLQQRETVVTVPEKRVLVAQIMIFRYRRFSATTPKNNSRDKTFVFVSEVSPILCLYSR